MKRNIFFSVLILALVLSVSCSGPEEKAFEANCDFGEQEMSFLGEDLVFSFVQKDFSHVFMYKNDTTFYDMCLDRLAALGQQYDFNRTFTWSPSLTLDLVGGVFSGQHLSDFVFSDEIPVLAADQCLYPVDVLDCIDLTDFGKYGFPGTLEFSMYCGHVYGLYPQKWPAILGTANAGAVLVMNEALMSKYGMTDPRDLVENGKWTTDFYMENSENYYISDPDHTVKALATNLANFGKAVQGSFGLDVVYRSPSGTELGLHAPNAAEAISWGKAFYDRTKKSSSNFKSDWEAWEETYEEKAVMGLQSIRSFNEMVLVMDDFGIVNFPSSGYVDPSRQSIFCTYIYSLGMLYDVEDPDMFGMLASEILEPFDGYETEDSLVKLLDSSVFFDIRDAVLYLELLKNQKYVYYHYDLGSFVSEGIGNDMAEKSVAEMIAAVGTQYDDVIEKYIAPNRDYLESLASGISN